jgi:DNA ligase (NAD+)
VEELNVSIGDIIRIERAGDVIPQVAEVVEHNSDRHYEYPDPCPKCASPLERDGPIVRCTGGLGCPSQQRRAIQHYTSRTGLDIDGFGEQTVDTLIDKDLIGNIGDLYELSVDDIATIEGYGEPSAKNLIDSIDTNREPELDDFITALGIREVGPTVAKSLAQEFGSFQALRTALSKQLQSVNDIGPITVSRIFDFFDSEENQAVLNQILRHVSPQKYDVEQGEAFDGETIVFTGSLPSYTRSEASDIVERAGGHVTSSVSSATDILVVGENPGSTKQSQAKENGVQMVSGRQFEERLEEI